MLGGDINISSRPSRQQPAQPKLNKKRAKTAQQAAGQQDSSVAVRNSSLKAQLAAGRRGQGSCTKQSLVSQGRVSFAGSSTGDGMGSTGRR